MITPQQYFERFGFCPPQVRTRPTDDLGLVVVLPCHAEPALLESLEALWRCERPTCSVEVLVVVNASALASSATQQLNRQTLAQAQAWAAARPDSTLRFHFLHFDQLPAKHAGVGLARKIGMDEGIHRLIEAGTMGEGILVSFDADCTCAADFLKRTEAHFLEHPGCPACSIYFEHPRSGSLPPQVYDAGALYELHLRYYIQGLRWAGYPFAYQTIGSSMAVRAPVYMAQGGMNKRQAGEDFYFLHKIMPLGGFMDLTRTAVFPSPRGSDRVPFGTGRAVRAQLEGARLQTYPIEAFRDLAGWFRSDDLERIENWRRAPESFRSFLEAQQFDRAWSEIVGNTAEGGTRFRRWLRWFDGFRVMKFIHHSRDHFYGAPPVESEAARLLAEYRIGEVGDMLEVYRDLARREVWAPPQAG